MLSRLADLAVRRPWALLAGNAAAAAIAIAASLGAPDELGVGSTRLDDGGHELVVVLEDAVGAGEGALDVARDVVGAQLAADPAVDSVRAAEATGDPRRSALLARLEPIGAADREATVERLADELDPGALRLTVGGEVAALIDVRREAGDELWRLELVVVPLVLLLAALAVGGRLVVAPVVCVATAVAGTLALLRIAGLVVDVSLLGVVPALVIGTVLGIELPALVARLHRDEAAIAPPAVALRETVTRAGPRLTGIAAAAALPALGLLVTPLGQAGSLALGCGLAAALAATSALFATPAAIAILGGVGDRRRAGASGDAAPPSGPALDRGAGLLASGRVRSAAAVVLALAAAAAIGSAALAGESRPFTAADLPPGSEVAEATALARAESADPGGSLFAELPLAAALAGGLVAVAFAIATRAPVGLLAGPFALLPAAAGLGASVFVLDQGHLAGLVGAEGRGHLDTAAVATAACALAAVEAAHAAIALGAVRARRRLGIDAVGAAELAATDTLPGAAAGALAGAAVAGTLLGSELAAAQEFGLAVAVGLAVGLLLARVPLLAALARGIR